MSINSKGYKTLTLIIMLAMLASVVFANKNVGQTNIINNLRIFASSHGQEVKMLENEGHCSGISSIWLKYKWLKMSLKHQLTNAIVTPIISMDHPDWFNNAIEVVANWDGKKPLSESEETIFKQLILLIDYAQNIEERIPVLSQLDLDQYLDCPNNKRIKKEYSVASLFTLEQLKTLLKIKNIIQEGKLICIQSYDHATALFKEDGKYYYFDPNSKLGEIEVTSVDKLAELIFQGFWLNDFTKPSAICFIMFTYDNDLSSKVKTTISYPDQKEVLDKINPTRELSNDGINGFMMAACSGSIESLHYFLASGTNPNLKDRDGSTALMLAIECNLNDTIKELLMISTVDPNIKNKSGDTALILAAKWGRKEAVKMLLAHPKIDKSVVNNDGKTAFDVAKTDEIKKLLAP